MKRLLSIILALLMLIGILASCGNYENLDDTATGDKPTVPPIEIEYDAEREAKDNEFPFDNIIVERHGYDIVAAGRYYGNDFDNIKYCGSYYRIIDNYEDFSELTQWGNKTNETIFNDNFILVLHSYKKTCNDYYTHPKYSELNGKGTYKNFGVNESGAVVIFESKSGSGGAVIGEGFVSFEECENKLPIETKETIYLIVPKTDLDSSVKVNGEIKLFLEITTDN